MLDHPGYARARLQKLAERLRALVYADSRPVEELVVAGPTDRISPSEARRLEHRPAKIGEQLGPLWATYWFRGRAIVPPEWRGRRVDLLWVSHSEAAVRVGGRVVSGLNHEPLAKPDGSTRPDATLVRSARGGEEIAFDVEVACNQLFGRPNRERIFTQALSPFVLERCDIAAFDREAWDLYFDLVVLADLEADGAQHGDLDPAWAGELLWELNRFANVIDPDDRKTWIEARAIVARLYERKNASRAHDLGAIGHAHIDTAWLWPLAETRRKCIRTFASQLAYAEDYPEHRFACSQAQQWAFVAEIEPELFERMREAARLGRFVPVGAMWVEPDCNVPSGESLVRQILYGQRYFEREIGIECREVWLPDAFGYCAQLPQIMAKSGIRRFLTQKLSWNRYEPPEHHTFLWRGLDGSEVLTHFPPADTYSSKADVAEIRKSARTYKDHVRSGSSMLLFGFGDGGGGPTRRMLEVLRRVRDLQGVPRTTVCGPNELFAKLEEDPRALPTVAGELYLEYHRGTYTSQAAVKRDNRRGEVLLHDAEVLAAIAHALGRATHPSAELERAWKVLLTNQFHDILPGSSIGAVYEDAARDYAEVHGVATRARDAAAAALFASGDGEAGGWAPINTLGHARLEVAATPEGELALVEAPACGVGKIVPLEAGGGARVERVKTGFVLENEILRFELSEDGTMKSLVLLANGREALEGPGNVLELYDDWPNEFDAWDIDPFAAETMRACEPATRAEIVESGPMRVEIAFVRTIGRASRMRQVVRLEAAAQRVEVECEVDWQERHALLRVAFPVRVRATDAAYGTQFGWIARPTHQSTRREAARFEVPAQRWSDLSEHGFGVALMSDTKYGFSTLDHTMRLSLLRGPTSPDPECDRGSHRFTYAVMPHAGDFRDAGVAAEAAKLGAPLVWARGDATPGAWFSVESGALVIDTVKKSEDGDSVVLRLYEPHGGRGEARLRTTLPLARWRACDLMERDTGLARVEGDEVVVPYGPFEIVTLAADVR